VDLRDAVNIGMVQGPRMLVSGPGLLATSKGNAPFPSIEGAAIYQNGGQIADGVDAVRKAVREQAHYGVDWIKIYSTQAYTLDANGTLVATPTFTLAETEAIVDEAHRQGLKVACHAYGGEGLHNCIQAGVDAPQHGLDLDDQSVKLLLSKKLPLVATLLDLSVEHDAEKKRMGASRWELMQVAFKKAHAAGITIPFGSGAGPYAHGTQLMQFAYMVKLGMTPAEALQSATSVAARLIGWQDRVGGLEKGKYADLVAVEGDPLQDILLMNKLGFVMKGGVVIRNDLK
jgi:imidazolonepropionase-like amidohydrolase